MKFVHTTNYYNTFIEIADDCLLSRAVVPIKMNGAHTIASAQYEMLSAHPYTYTSDDVLFTIFAKKHAIAVKDWIVARGRFFSKGQACMRSSPLPKRYGFGIHSNADGKVALWAIETVEYAELLKEKHIVHIKAMRSVKVK